MPWSEHSRPLARLVLFTFLLTFVAARVLVFCIMARYVPDLFLHLGGTHVHHLNYGIFILSAVGAFLIFDAPTGRRLRIVAALYGFGLALTFDEFGMWLHLGGAYWQRASFDAMTVLGGLLALAAFAPSFRHWRTRGWAAAGLVVIMSTVFVWLLAATFRLAAREEPRFRQLDQQTPP